MLKDQAGSHGKFSSQAGSHGSQQSGWFPGHSQQSATLSLIPQLPLQVHQLGPSLRFEHVSELPMVVQETYMMKKSGAESAIEDYSKRPDDQELYFVRSITLISSTTPTGPRIEILQRCRLPLWVLSVSPFIFC